MKKIINKLLCFTMLCSCIIYPISVNAEESIGEIVDIIVSSECYN